MFESESFMKNQVTRLPSAWFDALRLCFSSQMWDHWLIQANLPHLGWSRRRKLVEDVLEFSAPIGRSGLLFPFSKSLTYTGSVTKNNRESCVCIQDDGGWTALTMGHGTQAQRNHVRYLLSMGADPNIKDNVSLLILLAGEIWSLLFDRQVGISPFQLYWSYNWFSTVQAYTLCFVPFKWIGVDPFDKLITKYI